VSRWALAGLALTLLVLAALWVPVNRLPVPAGYYHTTWFEAFQPRGLMGTLAAALGLAPPQFVRLNLVGEAVFLFLLLLALARAWEGDTPDERAPWLSLALLTCLISFHQVIFVNHFLTGFVDIHSAVLTLGAVHLLAFDSHPPRPLALGLAAVLSSVSLLNHERSILDATVLATWLWLSFGTRAAACYFAPVAISLAAFLLGTSEQAYMGLSVPEYWANLEKAATYVREESGSLIGIFYGGGFAWLLWLYGAGRLLRAKRAESRRALLKAAAFVLVSLVACLAPLMVAHDTTRLVGLMWLPTLLMLTTTRFPPLLARSRWARGFVAALALLQLALPPLFIYRFGAVPLNCYAQKAVRALCAQEPRQQRAGLDHWLVLYEDGGHRPWYLKRCRRLRVFRH
jgi:hypothetical protein